MIPTPEPPFDGGLTHMVDAQAQRVAAQLGREARERYLLEMCRAMVGVTGTIQSCLTALMGQSGTSAEMQLRRDAWSQFQIEGENWREATTKAWQQYLAKPVVAQQSGQAKRIKLELQDQEVVESQIVVSRFVELLMEGVALDFNQLRMRMKEIEGIVDLASRDVLRPEVLVSMMLEQWSAVGMPEGSWLIVQGAAAPSFEEALVMACRASNEFLVQRGVLPRGFHQVRMTNRTVVSLASGAEHIAVTKSSGDGRDSMGDGRNRVTPGWVSGSDLQHVVQNHQMGPSLDLALIRAEGVIGQLKNLLHHRVAGFDPVAPLQRSPALARAIAPKPAAAADSEWIATEYLVQTMPMDMDQVVGNLRESTSVLKKTADTDSERAVIEVVALMFQSILMEDRIPTAVRMWVARLQMPVLRIALEDSEFFDNLNHPARLLIDRIGSCVMGFDVATINGSELEAEIKRLVQVIEQFPETGRQVYQKVYDEFLQFLSRLLTGKGVAQRVVSVVQQVEQKETLAIKYTIEMRNMLKDIPVREEIRQFLFKVWADVLAVAAVKHSPQDEQIQMYKRAATDLVWSASAKPSRSARTRVIQNLPVLLQNLRQWMNVLGLSNAVQETHIKVISDALADAFMSKAEAVPYALIESMTRQLARLEDVVPPNGVGDLPLDAESIEMMLGIDASSLVVVAEGGTPPTPDMVNWATALSVGTWFTLDHNGAVSRVQFAWRSDKQKLHLFAAPNGSSYLIQAGRLAAYLQAGLLVPLEDEALTVRATRDALAKLEANPERLIQ